MTKSERNSKGGKSRWKNVPKKARTKAMRKCAKARWNKPDKQGVIRFGFKPKK